MQAMNENQAKTFVVKISMGLMLGAVGLIGLGEWSTNSQARLQQDDREDLTRLVEVARAAPASVDIPDRLVRSVIPSERLLSGGSVSIRRADGHVNLVVENESRGFCRRVVQMGFTPTGAPKSIMIDGVEHPVPGDPKLCSDSFRSARSIAWRIS